MMNPALIELMKKKKWVTVGHVRRQANFSTTKMAKLLSDGTLNSFTHPLDRRCKLLRLKDVERSLKMTIPLEELDERPPPPGG